jgi:hypothetical protein
VERLFAVGSEGIKKRKRRRALPNSDFGSTIPPVPYGFARQGTMGAFAGLAGTIRAVRHGNASQQRAARILLAVLFGLPMLALVAVAIAVVATS